MPRLKDVTIAGKQGNDVVSFRTTINVTSDGSFTTTIPSDFAQKFEDAGFSLDVNRSKNKGFFQSNSLEGLEKQLHRIMDEYCSKTLIKEEIVIQYVIHTICHYCLSEGDKGEPVPNGSWVKEGTYKWLDGEGVTPFSSSSEPYGFEVYANPSIKRTYRYGSGKEHVTYDFIRGQVKNPGDDDYYLNWLAGVVKIYKPRHATVQEVPYTEDTARFFVELISSVMKLNERIKNFTNPEAIINIASKHLKMLG